MAIRVLLLRRDDPGKVKAQKCKIGVQMDACTALTVIRIYIFWLVNSLPKSECRAAITGFGFGFVPHKLDA
jgi:hypothetical protein